jgi:hypothetical protein
MDVPEPDQSPFTAMSAHTSKLTRQYQSYLDASTPYTTYRWVGTGVLLFFFFLRIVFAQGWYIGTSSLNLVWCLHMREWLQLSRHESGESDRMTARTNR